MQHCKTSRMCHKLGRSSDQVDRHNIVAYDVDIHHETLSVTSRQLDHLESRCESTTSRKIGNCSVLEGQQMLM